ncbi:hypothetical protein [Thermus sp. 93170]|jgi:hypothetical protein|uniref:hypothetical protein n=1 Tax=Thermus sp. 93170 TaxID=1046939 RepID=UPI0031FB1C8A
MKRLARQYSRLAARFLWWKGLLSLRVIGPLLLLGLWGGLARGQGGEIIRDALHGFSLFLPPGYSVSVRDYGLVVGDLEAFLLVRGMPLKAPREAVTPLVQEAQAMARGRPALFFKTVPGGLLLAAQGLVYPYRLAPSLALRAFQDPFFAGLTYEAAHLLLRGDRQVLAVSVFLPTDASATVRGRAFQVLRSLEFLPVNARVAYGVQRVYDPLLGMEAFALKVPQGYAFRGALVPTGDGPSVRQLAFTLDRPGVSQRMDVLFLVASGLQTGLGGNASTIFGWNGQKRILPGFLCPTTPEEVAQLLVQLWSQERGQEWQVAKLEPSPAATNRIARRLEELRAAEEAQMDSYLMQMPRGGQWVRARWDHTLEARSGGLSRQAYFRGDVLASQQADWVAASGLCQVRLEVLVREGTPSALAQSLPVFNGVLLGIRAHPEWPWLEALRARRASEEETRRVLEVVRQGEEFNAWMRRSWTNLLSDQTYVRDPSTGEVFKVYKESFRTGTFWRDPVFGGLVGAVERGSRLEEALRQGGWRQLEQSLSGLPNTWGR